VRVLRECLRWFSLDYFEIKVAFMRSDGIIGSDPAFLALLSDVERLSKANVHVLLTGETGTGKELFAQLIHTLGARVDKPFMALNCAALPRGLAESELFGCVDFPSVDGVFNKQGILANVNGGVLYLDELNALPISTQAKLLSFLDEGCYTPVGGLGKVSADVRIIASSNADMKVLMNTGLFRSDLYYRISVMNLHIPALRDRRCDILDLLKYYCRFFSEKYKLRIVSFTSKSLEKLLEYPWPGNIRELKNLCENLTIAQLSRAIEPEDLPIHVDGSGILSSDTASPAWQCAAFSRPENDGLLKGLVAYI
jgi:DNA-binding NtrC family response regulator